MDYLSTLIKILVGSIVLIVYTRVTGRSQIAPLSTADVVSGIVIGALISESVLNEDITTLDLLIIVAFWTVLMLIVRWLKSRRVRAELLLDGKDIQLVSCGKPLPKNFASISISLRDFETLIHQQGIPSIDSLEDVWFEANGQLSIVKKGDAPYSVLLVENGQMYRDNLAELGRDEHWLKEQLHMAGYDDYSAVFCAEWHDGSLWAYPKD